MGPTMTDEHRIQPSVLLEIAGGVASITLNRPERLNAYDQEMIDLWGDHLETAIASAEVRVILLKGAGRAFCSGGHADGVLERSMESPAEIKAYFDEHVHRIARLMFGTDKATIAAIQGYALSGGLDMALMCDLRLAAENAIFAETYVNTGLIAGAGGTYHLPRLIGAARALELFWTGRRIDAQEALDLGIVHRIAPNDDLASVAEKLAATIAGQPAEAVRYFKRAVYQGLGQDLESHLDLVSSHLAVLRHTEEHRMLFRQMLDTRNAKKLGQS